MCAKMFCARGTAGWLVSSRRWDGVVWGACVSGLRRVALYLALRLCWWCWRDDGDDRSFRCALFAAVFVSLMDELFWSGAVGVVCCNYLQGGAVYVGSGTFDASGCTFTSNSAVAAFQHLALSDLSIS